MKKTDKTTKLMQQGGLMIEALAMLGLITVVTPTMYKKSAERTLEVEDINTATTVRTYMNAAEAYIANNYGDLMVNQFSVRDETTGRLTPVASGSKVVSLTKAQLAPYLPYKFDTDRSLYDYNTPTVSIVNNGTNLTAFALFPAKQSAANGIGQERTARIASLVGANGGYMPDTTTARGVGGLWSLDEDTVKKMFGDGAKNAYSLVAASSNVISDVSGGEMDNDKYLQRTLEGNPNDPESYKDQLWRNTMHTDLYMGENMTGETQSIAESLRSRNSIRDVKSLIIGAEKANESTKTEDADGNEVIHAPTSDDTRYGLYISGGEGNLADAYIGGALRATAEQFVVTSNGKFNRTADESAIPQMVFGKNGSEYNFEVDENGDIYDYGHKGQLFNRFKDEGNNLVDIANKVIEISNPATEANPNGVLHMHLMDDDTFRIYQNTDGEGNITDMQMDIMKNGYKGMPKRVDMDEDGNEVVSGQNENALGAIIGINYSDSVKPQFPVHVGSNMAVEGIMAAGQVDTTLVRTAGLTAGSNKIDDQYKWIDVDKNGVRMRDPDGRTMKDTEKNVLTNVGDRTSLVVDKEKIALRVGDSSGTVINSITGFDGHPTQFVMRSTSDGSDTISKMSGQAHEIGFNATNASPTDETPGYIQTRNSKVQVMVGSEEVTTGEGESATTTYTGEIKFSGLNEGGGDDRGANYRVRQLGGHMDLERANLRVIDENNNQVFSVRGNSLKENNDKYDNYYTNGKEGTSIDYHIAAHGNTLFTGTDKRMVTVTEKANDGSTKTHEEEKRLTYMSVGKYNADAGVSIMADGKNIGNYIKNVLVIDQTEDVDSINSPDSSIMLREYTVSADSHGKPVHKSRGNIIAQYSENRGEPGTIYIRKGMIDIANGDYGSDNDDKRYLAHEGTGIVRASRFVANNTHIVKENGKRILKHDYAVPTKLTGKEFNQYNGAGRTRYDTYMVNPAYTSVMNDIKLVSRGGARLSDILPDFINKGIYVANNTNKNVAKLGKVEDTSTTITFVFNGWDTNNATAYPTATGETEEADVSAYLGQVPAPQCPPGYGRVITVAPVSFKMAQAGGIEHNGSKFKVREDKASAFKSETDYEAVVDKFKDDDKDGKRASDNYVPSYNKLRIGLEGQGTLHVDAQLPDMPWSENSTGASGTIKGVHLNTLVNISDYDENGVTKSGLSNNFPVKMCDQTQETTDGEECTLLDTYVLSSNVKDGFKPVLFQQSTYLKTAVVPLCSKSKTYFGMTSCPEDEEYHQGWAVLMGFIYPYTNYKGVIESINAPVLARDSSTSETWYWNIFPVRKNSLEAYATVYCFYDRTNIFWGYDPSEVDGYDYMNAATSFTPDDNDKARREELNDPTLKYNELW